MRKSIKYVIIKWSLSACLLLVAAYQAAFSQGSLKAYFKGSFKNGTYIHYYWLDSIDEPDQLLKSFKRETRFSDSMVINQYKQIAFNTNNYRPVYYFLFPGDTINVNCIEGKYFDISANNKIRNQELIVQKNLIMNFGGFHFLGEKDSSYQYNCRLINKNTGAALRYLQRELTQSSISKRMFELARNVIVYSDINSKLYPVYLNTSITEAVKDTLSSLIIHFNKDSLIGINEYRNASYNYLKYLILSNEKKVSFESMIGVCTSKFIGLTQEYLLSRIYKEFRAVAKRRSVDSIISSIIFKDPFYYSFVNAELRSYRTVSEINTGKPVVITPEGKAMLLDSVLKSMNSELIYIDFWASWCIPCLEEMEFYPDLIESFTGKSVSFVFISLDSKTPYWIRKMDQFTFMEGRSYLLQENFNAPFAKELNITAIPRYMLLNKNGEVINSNAPRPSDGNDLKIYLQKKLSEKKPH